MPLYLTDAVREIDRVTIEERGIPGLTLMKRAATACVEQLLARRPTPGKVAVLCGSGNNAGDGFIVAGMLASKGVRVAVCLVGKQPVAQSDAGEAFAYCQQSAAELVSLDSALADCSVIVDALLGTGLAGDISPAFAEAIDAVNDSPAWVLSVDLPSGLNANTGQPLACCVRADLTVTFIARKLGLMTADGPEYTGQLVLADLGVDPTSVDVEPAATMLSFDRLIPELPRRHRNAHKVGNGHLLIVGGNRGMAGAVAMAAEAALYVGAGMVSVATREANTAVVVTRRPEIMARGMESVADLRTLLERCRAVVVGPGLGQDEWAEAMLARVLEAELPTLIDADGLNLLAGMRVRRDNWILTPHPGEASRLLGSAGGQVQADRLAAVHDLKARYGGTILLKGAGTLIAGDRTSLCPHGNPGMAVAGMGDVLSGVIGGLLVQGLSFETATCLGAVLHARAADTIVARQGERGLLATELFSEIRAQLNAMPADD